MVGFEIQVEVAPKKRGEFLQAFKLLTNVDQQEVQRVALNLYENVHESNTFLWLEYWDNAKGLENYCNDDRCLAMMGAIEILGQLVHRRTFSVKDDTENEKASAEIA
jgi:quinol monooxygenase YgiN